MRTITNTGDSARDYSFTFSIAGGHIGGDFNYWQDGDAATGSYNIVIALNDAPIWQSAAVLRLVGDAANLSKSGVDLGGALHIEFDYPGQLRAHYRPDYYTGTLALGTLAAGESLKLSYDMQAGVEIDAPNSCDYECFEFSASISDPNAVSSVPLPATLPLMLLGLAGLRGARRLR